MVRLHVGGAVRWYVCRECGSVRENVCDREGLVVGTNWHTLDGGTLSEAVIGEARAVLEEGEPEQLSLWSNQVLSTTHRRRRPVGLERGGKTMSLQARLISLSHQSIRADGATLSRNI
jgi:hypothetical protein